VKYLLPLNSLSNSSISWRDSSSWGTYTSFVRLPIISNSLASVLNFRKLRNSASLAPSAAASWP
jgi:hypothetical protein